MDEGLSLSASERELMAVIRATGPVARSDLTGLTSLSQQSVHRLIEQLMQKRLLRLGAPVIRGRGKPSPAIEIAPEGHVSLGLSIGTEHLRFAALDLIGAPLAEEELNLTAADPDVAIHHFRKFMARWSDAPEPAPKILGVGVALQGYRTGPKDEFYPPDPLDGWRASPLAEIFHQALALPVFVENNASASAVAEHALGGGERHGSLVYLGFNAGFGAGLVDKNAVMLGAHGNAGEISTIFTQDEITHRPALGELIKRLQASGIPIANLQQLRAEFDPEWPAIAAWLDEIRPQLQLSLRAFKAIADPAAIYFGGDAPAALRRMLIETSQGAFGQQASPNPDLLPSGIEGDAAHLGAAFFPLNAMIY